MNTFFLTGVIFIVFCKGKYMYYQFQLFSMPIVWLFSIRMQYIIVDMYIVRITIKRLSIQCIYILYTYVSSYIDIVVYCMLHRFGNACSSFFHSFSVVYMYVAIFVWCSGHPFLCVIPSHHVSLMRCRCTDFQPSFLEDEPHCVPPIVSTPWVGWTPNPYC